MSNVYLGIAGNIVKMLENAKEKSAFLGKEMG